MRGRWGTRTLARERGGRPARERAGERRTCAVPARVASGAARGDIPPALAHQAPSAARDEESGCGSSARDVLATRDWSSDRGGADRDDSGTIGRIRAHGFDSDRSKPPFDRGNPRHRTWLRALPSRGVLAQRRGETPALEDLSPRPVSVGPAHFAARVWGRASPPRASPPPTRPRPQPRSRLRTRSTRARPTDANPTLASPRAVR